MKLAIIHADDYGWSEGVNHAILDSHQYGILTSTSVIATMPGFLDAVDRRKEAPGLGFGAHLSLNLGRPISRPGSVPLLVDSNGYFHYSYLYHLMKSNQRQYLDQCRRELAAQIQFLVNNGFSLDHLNSQSHIHMIPKLYDITRELADEMGNLHLRLSGEYWYGTPRIRKPTNLLKCLTLSALQRCRYHDMQNAVRFIGIRHSGGMYAKTLETYLRNLGTGTWEIALHPGTGVLNDDSGFQTSAARWIRSTGRRLEWDALVSKSVQTALKEADITTLRFADLNR